MSNNDDVRDTQPADERGIRRGGLVDDTEGHTAKVHGVLDDRDETAEDTTGHIGNHKF